MTRHIVIDSPRHIANGQGAITKTFETETNGQEALSWLLGQQSDRDAFTYREVEDIEAEMGELETDPESWAEQIDSLREIQEDIERHGKNALHPIVVINHGGQEYKAYAGWIAAVTYLASDVLDDPNVEVREEHPGAGLTRVYATREKPDLSRPSWWSVKETSRLH